MGQRWKSCSLRRGHLASVFRVLQSAGYAVAECHSVELLAEDLGQNLEAVLLEEEPKVPVDTAVCFTRSRSPEDKPNNSI